MDYQVPVHTYVYCEVRLHWVIMIKPGIPEFHCCRQQPEGQMGGGNGRFAVLEGTMSTFVPTCE